MAIICVPARSLAFSPVMKSVEKFAKSGGMVLGICNGFQILLEAVMLPGDMMRNGGLRYICRHVHIRVEQTDTPFTNAARHGQILTVPIAHNDGNYTCDEATLADIEKNRQVVFRYTTLDGSDDAAGNPNGSMNNIAGICNRERNVAGLMPHPERAVESALGSDDGLVVFKSMKSKPWWALRRPRREDACNSSFEQAPRGVPHILALSDSMNEELSELSYEEFVRARTEFAPGSKKPKNWSRRCGHSRFR